MCFIVRRKKLSLEPKPSVILALASAAENENAVAYVINTHKISIKHDFHLVGVGFGSLSILEKQKTIIINIENIKFYHKKMKKQIDQGKFLNNLCH